jgi:trehalose 6-phosphate phosphatase
LFLDFDGTLVDLAATPEAIRVPAELPGLLETLQHCFAGAVAILTGRSLTDLDRHAGTSSCLAAGQHGAEIRSRAEGESILMAAPALDAVRDEIGDFAAHHPGVLIEDKGASVALHYRAAPAEEKAVRARAESLVGTSSGALEVIAGKSLYELRPTGVNKGRALRRFLDVAPFVGRKPLVLGDDVTDEAAFEVALESGGSAIKVGLGASAAPWWLADPEAVRTWLAGLCES